jgi:hypothetical protein
MKRKCERCTQVKYLIERGNQRDISLIKIRICGMNEREIEDKYVEKGESPDWCPLGEILEIKAEKLPQA